MPSPSCFEERPALPRAAAPPLWRVRPISQRSPLRLRRGENGAQHLPRRSEPDRSRQALGEDEELAIQLERGERSTGQNLLLG